MLDYFAGRVWDWHPFLPALSSLIVSSLVAPIAESLLGKQLRANLAAKNFSAAQTMITEAVARDRTLQLATVSTFLTTVFLLVSLGNALDRAVLDAIILVVVVAGLVVSAAILLKMPGFLSTTLVRWRVLRRYRVTYAGFYNTVLIVINILALVLTIPALPKRGV